MARAKKKATAVVKSVPADVYVCIRRCFFRGRMWMPKPKAVKERDYLLTVVHGTEVSEKNFLKVEAVPEFAPVVEKEEGVALSSILAKDVIV